MSNSTAAAILLVALPVAFNAAFGLLAARFDCPDIQRRPTGEVLERFRQGGSGLVLPPIAYIAWSLWLVATGIALIA